MQNSALTTRHQENFLADAAVVDEVGITEESADMRFPFFIRHFRVPVSLLRARRARPSSWMAEFRDAYRLSAAVACGSIHGRTSVASMPLQSNSRAWMCGGMERMAAMTLKFRRPAHVCQTETGAGTERTE